MNYKFIHCNIINEFKIVTKSKKECTIDEWLNNVKNFIKTNDLPQNEDVMVFGHNYQNAKKCVNYSMPVNGKDHPVFLASWIPIIYDSAQSYVFCQARYKAIREGLNPCNAKDAKAIDKAADTVLQEFNKYLEWN